MMFDFLDTFLLVNFGDQYYKLPLMSVNDAPYLKYILKYL